MCGCGAPCFVSCYIFNMVVSMITT